MLSSRTEIRQVFHTGRTKKQFLVTTFNNCLVTTTPKCKVNSCPCQIITRCKSFLSNTNAYTYSCSWWFLRKCRSLKYKAILTSLLTIVQLFHCSCMMKLIYSCPCQIITRCKSFLSNTNAYTYSCYLPVTNAYPYCTYS